MLRNSIMHTILGTLILGAFSFFYFEISSGYSNIYTLEPGTNIMQPFYFRDSYNDYPLQWNLVYFVLGISIIAYGIGLILINLKATKISSESYRNRLFILSQVVFWFLVIASISWLRLYPYWISNNLFIIQIFIVIGVSIGLNFIRRISFNNANNGYVDLFSPLTQITLGGLLVIYLTWYITQIEPRWGTMTFYGTPGTNVSLTIYHHTYWVILLLAWKVLNYLIAAIFIGWGILQFKKARRIMNARRYSNLLQHSN